jgi:hypothetical protein
MEVKIQHGKNSRGQSPLGVRSLAFVNLCLLGSLELSLELIAQGEQSPFRYLSHVVHVENDNLKDNDIGSIPTVLWPHWQEKCQGPQGVLSDEPKPLSDREEGLQDNETDRPQQCWEPVHGQSKESYCLKGRSVANRSVSSRGLVTIEGIHTSRL